MRDFSAGIRLNENEDEYQSALQDHRGRFVLSLKPNRNGLFTLHDAGCLTVSYDLKRAGHSRRSGKILFSDRAELDAWHKNNRWVGKLNKGCHECPRCRRESSRRTPAQELLTQLRRELPGIRRWLSGRCT